MALSRMKCRAGGNPLSLCPPCPRPGPKAAPTGPHLGTPLRRAPESPTSTIAALHPLVVRGWGPLCRRLVLGHSHPESRRRAGCQEGRQPETGHPSAPIFTRGREKQLQALISLKARFPHLSGKNF